MSYNSKRTIASIIGGVFLIIAYIIYALGEHSPTPEDLKSWAIAILVFIGIGVITIIVIQIIFHIATAIVIAVKEEEHNDEKNENHVSSLMVEDERDKLINLKSAHIGYLFVGIGFILALFNLAFNMPSVFALHILFGSFAIGSIIEGIATVYFYEKGVHNG